MQLLSPTLEDALDGSAAPAWSRVVLTRLVEDRPELVDRFHAEPSLLRAVVEVTGISNALTRVIETDPAALHVLADLGHRTPPPTGRGDDSVTSDDSGTPVDDLVAWKRRELLRIAARDQLGVDRLDQTGVLLSRLAADVLTAALALAGDGAAERLAVVGMGKLGAYELNYASDIDVMFVCDDADDAHALSSVARAVLEVAGRCFRVDANLRPEGRNGPLVRTLSSYAAYWKEWAQPWEFQALIKASPAAGPPPVRSRFAELSHEHLWSRRFSADDLRSLRDMKARAEAEVQRRSDADREVKRGPGGIRDVEFSAQLLQLVHGRHDPALREPNTLAVTAELGAAGYVDEDDAAVLSGAYRFLRAVEHRLQLVEEQQVYAVPTGDEARTRLARSLGFRDTPTGDAAGHFDVELARWKGQVRSVHERLYFRPLLEAFSAAPGAERALSAEAAEERLTAFGFTDAARTRQAVQELTRGLTRSSRLMQQLLPLLLQWLSQTPDPDQGLLALRTLTTGTQRSATLTQAFRESPETARRLCHLVGSSQLVARLLHHNPDLAEALADDDRLRPRSRGRLVERATAALAWRGDEAERQQGLHRFTDREGLRIMAADLLDVIDTPTAGRSLTLLAESALDAALAMLDPQVSFCVIAMGRFGGAELAYVSDLDVLFVHEGDGQGANEEALRVATGLLQLIGGPTPARRIYEIDANLRPEGKQGLLSRTIDGFVAYHERWAQPWERQAMVRARPCAGDLELGHRLLEALAPFVWDAPVTAGDLRELRRIKARVETERIPPGEDPEFHLKLGKGALNDVEFTAQLLQLQHRAPAPGTLAALSSLVEAGALDRHDAEVLAAAWRFCERTRNRLHLVHGTPRNALPQEADDLNRLARSLQITPTGLREEYRRLTRRARVLVERLFYGRG